MPLYKTQLSEQPETIKYLCLKYIIYKYFEKKN